MLSLFPTLLSYSQVAPLVIRVLLGIIFLFWCYQTFRKPSTGQQKILAGIEGVVGILFVIGMFVQAAALVASIYFIVRLIERAHKKALLTDGVNYYLILLVLALSLLVTGAGVYAIDLAA